MRTALSSSSGGRKMYRNRSAGEMDSQIAKALESGPKLQTLLNSCSAPPAVALEVRVGKSPCSCLEGTCRGMCIG